VVSSTQIFYDPDPTYTIIHEDYLKINIAYDDVGSEVGMN
jgi:hypothetical protein